MGGGTVPAAIRARGVPSYFPARAGAPPVLGLRMVAAPPVPCSARLAGQGGAHGPCWSWKRAADTPAGTSGKALAARANQTPADAEPPSLWRAHAPSAALAAQQSLWGGQGGGTESQAVLN